MQQNKLHTQLASQQQPIYFKSFDLISIFFETKLKILHSKN